MSDTEVTVERGQTSGMWRLEYKGHYDFYDDEPTAAQKESFRKTVIESIRRRSAESKVRLNAGGHGGPQVTRMEG